MIPCVILADCTFKLKQPVFSETYGLIAFIKYTKMLLVLFKGIIIFAIWKSHSVFEWSM